MYKIEFEIDNRNIAPLNTYARQKLKDYTKVYSEEIIEVAKGIETSARQAGATQSVTDNHIIMAVGKYKIEPKQNKKSKFFGLLSSVLLVIIGFMFEPDWFILDGKLNTAYLLIFLVVFMITLILTIFTFFPNNN